MIHTSRRTFLKGTLAGTMVGVAVGAGLLKPRLALAETWPKAAFEAKSVNDALKAMFGTDAHSASGDITIKAPEIAENGAVVPITVSTKLSGVDSISIIAAENPSPLTSSYDLAKNTEGYVPTRIKMGKTSDVIAVVKSGDKLYSTSQQVKVTIGGCGG
jgi:sulfur-oxidizing protein SoxY